MTPFWSPALRTWHELETLRRDILEADADGCNRAAVAADQFGMADNYYYHMYVETQETRELREQHNLRETGEKSATSEAEPTMIELPTAAGSVMLDLSDPQQGGSAQSGPSGAMRAGTGPLRSRDQLGKLGRNSSGLGKKDKSKRKKGGGEEEENPTGGARDKRSSQDEGDLFSRRDDEDEIPPLTAEVCACTVH